MTAPGKSESVIERAAARLRAEILARENGVLLGNEDALQALLGVSRATVRQVARLLEREGLLRVRRGINGGYFGARPDAGVIEETVSSYLAMLHVPPEDLTIIASVLWVEVIRKAASLNSAEARSFAARFRGKIMALPDNASFDDLFKLEAESRKIIFKLANSPYIELIFQINVTFSRRTIPTAPSEQDGTAEHLDFVRRWRAAKCIELDAIHDGDPELGILAARRTRALLHRRLWA